jgi:CDP-diacylglycerol--serine O-phosphatidyltransferase
MISNIATTSWTSIRPRRSVRLELLVILAIVGAALLTEPWLTLVGICLFYLAGVPYGVWSYAKVKRQRAARAAAAAGPPPAEA